MVFANIEYLFLLLLLIPYIVWYIMRRKNSEATLQISDARVYAHAPKSYKNYLLHAPFALRIIALTLIILVLARPQTTDSWQNSEIEGIDIMLAIDVSTSMLAEDLKPNRLEAAKDVAAEFINGRPNDNVGITLFAGESFTQCPLTVDHAVLLNLIKDVKCGLIEDGTAVGMGIANATGLYFKVVDSDDWVKQDAYFKILDTLRELAGGGQALDMLISNYVYEKEGERRKKVIQYRHILPVEKMFTWADCHHFIKGHYILMHSVIFRTKLLQECGLKLPEHTFYVDNLYVFEPLPYVKNMYYLDVNFYRYYIGRQDQSVNETVMISRIDQQIRVTKLMIDYLVAKKQELVKNRRLYQYMRNYLEIIMTVSSVLLIRSGTQEHLDKKKELWEYLKSKDKRLYLWMRNGIMGGTMNLPGRGGRKISVEGYKICQKLFGFN